MAKVEFVSYDGEYPNLCSGVLTILIDGVKRELPKYCLCSGGAVWFTDEWDAMVEYGDWGLAEEFLPEDLKPLKEEIEKVINENVPQGCCGGCI